MSLKMHSNNTESQNPPVFNVALQKCIYVKYAIRRTILIACCKCKLILKLSLFDGQFRVSKSLSQKVTGNGKTLPVTFPVTLLVIPIIKKLRETGKQYRTKDTNMSFLLYCFPVSRNFFIMGITNKVTGKVTGSVFPFPVIQLT